MFLFFGNEKKEKSKSPIFNPIETKRTYDTEANKLAQAIDIAIEAFQMHCPPNFKKEHQDHFINTYKSWKESCLHPEANFKNLSSLSQTMEHVFTYFQEGTGEAVEYFWKVIAEKNLPFHRENKLKKILERGKIKGRIEFDYLVDMFVVAQQNGMISREEAIKLSGMLEKYEKVK